MKYPESAQLAQDEKSLPVRGAWVEMPCVPCIVAGLIWSLPVRGAWVEIFLHRFFRKPFIVAPRAGSVG